MVIKTLERVSKKLLLYNTRRDGKNTRRIMRRFFGEEFELELADE